MALDRGAWAFGLWGLGVRASRFGVLGFRVLGLGPWELTSG